MNYLTKCRKCGAPIILMDTFKGKRLPVDTERVSFVIGGKEERRFVADGGDVYRGEIAGDGEQEHDRLTGWACHFDTCKAQ